MPKTRVLKQEEMKNFTYVKSNAWEEECESDTTLRHEPSRTTE
jgi:hypothetical protein